MVPPVPPVDVAVLGGGHAGVEAAVAASRLGLTVALISPHGFDSVGLLSCNPSIGGSGKSHLVCETDACGGLIGRAADIAAVHWRVLNVSRGPAAWAPRVQLDRVCFSRCVRRLLFVFSSIMVIDAAAEEILTEQQRSQQDQQASQQQRVWGVKLTDGSELQASAVVVAAGTFLDAAVAIGSCKAAGGRMHSVAESAATAQRSQGPQQQYQQQQQLPIQAIADVEPSAKGLAASLQKLGLRTAYFKTGTPARLLGSSIDFEKLQRQPSDPTPRPFSAVHTPQQMRARRGGWIDCFLGKTSDKTREIVQQYAHTLPRHREDDGRGVGPRYCPSIANKVRLFPHNPFHIVWLEPEDSSLSIIYPGGLSGAFPPAVQQELLHSIPGLERAKPIRYAYDVEYLVVRGTDVAHNLEAKTVGGLFLAGQVLGTTGYEEAAALGLLAGWNAGLYAIAQRKPTPVKRSKHEPLAPETAESAASFSSTSEAGGSRRNGSLHELPRCVILNPAKSMTGAVAEQLTARDAIEPLRAFAARVTSRLSMRCDNAQERMLSEVLHGHLFHEDHPRVKRARRRVADVKALVELIRQFELPASRWRVLINRAMYTLEEQQEQQDIARQDSAKTTFSGTGAARQPGPVVSAAAPVADRQHMAYVRFIEAPPNLLLLGLRCWESAVGNGGRRWSAAQLLAALPPALAKLEQGGPDTAESQTTDTPQGSFVNATNEKNNALGDNGVFDYRALNPSVQRGKEERQQGRDCVALQLLVALILDELTRQYSSSSSNGWGNASAARTGEWAQREYFDLLNQQGESCLLSLLFRCLSPSVGGHIASTVYAEVRYSFYFQREAREVAATESDDIIPTDLSMAKYPFLCREELDCLRRFHPRTFKEAARLGCLRPASALQLMRSKRLSQSKNTAVQEQHGQ